MTRRPHNGDYHYSVAWSVEDNCYVARCLEFELLGAHGDTLIEAYDQIEEAVAFCLSDIRRTGGDEPLPLGWPFQRDA